MYNQLVTRRVCKFGCKTSFLSCAAQAELAAQLADMKHLVASTPEELLHTLLSMDLAALEPYQPGDAAPLVAHIDAILGFA